VTPPWALCKYLAVILVVAARPIGIAATRFAARMLLPVGAAFGPLTRTVELRTILAGTIETGTIAFGAIRARARKPRAVVTAVAIFARLVKTWFIVARLIEIPRGLPRGARIASGVVGRRRIALLPRF
jgi:hypothetical protein